MLPALLFALQYSHPQLAVRCGRRAALGSLAAAGFISPVAAATDPDPAAASPVTKMDAFQLKASYKGLDDALQAWRVEIAQVQLGNEPSSVVAIAGLADGQLNHFAASGSLQAVESFKKRRDAMLQNLYLARGAARYEKDTSVAQTYIEKARQEAEGARDELLAIASAAGVELTAPRPGTATTAAEDAIVFQPRSAPTVQNRLVF